MIIRRHCEALTATSRYFTLRGVRPQFGLKTTNNDRAIALVRAGLGVTVVPQSFRDEEIRQIKLEDFELTREIGLMFNNGDRQSDLRERVFLKSGRQLMGRADNDASLGS